jgi:hypothetical protein
MKTIHLYNLTDNFDDPVYGYLSRTHHKSFRICFPFSNTAIVQDPVIYKFEYQCAFYLMERLHHVSTRMLAAVPGIYDYGRWFSFSVYVPFPQALVPILVEAAAFYGFSEHSDAWPFLNGMGEFWDKVSAGTLHPACEPFLYYIKRLEQDEELRRREMH